ncbi:MAG: hypothetical protein LBD59_12515 [Prevotellaceae bacterium]|jgi:hypothetical protein|nr:hypothetical protein [Prevotellaceae bacterium]
MKKKIFLIICSMSTTFAAFTQNTCQKAQTAFENGQYQQSVGYYNVCKRDFGKDVTAEIEKATQCQNLSTSAENYFAAKDYVKAAEAYYAIIALNPKDKNAKSRQSEIKKTAGVEYYNNGYYVGEFNSKGERQGKGTYYWTDSRYEGEWANGKQHGQGSYYGTDSRYEGGWANGKLHGQVTIYYADGTTKTGNFVNGELPSDHKVTLDDLQISETETEAPRKLIALGLMFSPSAEGGVLLGACGKRVGGYASAKGSLSMTKSNVASSENLDVNLNKHAHNRWAVSAGLLIRLFDQCYLYGGLGYGKYGKAYTINNSSNYYIPTLHTGLDVECGLLYSFGKFYIAAGYNTLTAPTQIEDFSVGLGIAFH